jgi:TRL-like protein family
MRTLKHIVFCILATALVLISPGCAYMHVQRPLGTNFDNTQLGTKEGRSNAYSLLWLVAWGDAGTKTAAKQGDIKVIRYADTEVKSVLLGLYSRVTTVVYGD